MRKLENALSIPSRIMEETKYDPARFLYALQDWEQFNPAGFDLALHELGGSLLHTARKVKWLCNPDYERPSPSIPTHPVKQLVDLLENELTSQQWMILVRSGARVSVKGNIEAKEMIKACVDNNLLTRELKGFCDTLEVLQRSDLAGKVRNYITTFKGMSNIEFYDQIRKETEQNVDTDQDVEVWQIRLKRYMKTQNKDVSAVLDEAAVHIESIFTPLTIIKIESVDLKEGESGINEIDFLRNMHEQVEHETVEVVDFEEIIMTCNPTEHKVWCLIGHPGSGKSFLCQHFAYSYGDNALTNFLYAISIPCRSKEWHLLEEVRHEAKQEVNYKFIFNWLVLSMASGADWSKSLSEYLIRTNGEGLLILMDGVDEFTKSVPFESTLLSRLLQRHFLAHSSILVTSRPGAWSDLQFHHGAGFRVDSNFQVLGFSPNNRDLYFQKRIETPAKLSEVHEMFHRHDEIKQLSLVPVNASLFSALFNQAKSILTQTLSHLYTELIVYIIRRQLSRMGLEEQSEILIMSDFHPAIKDCIHAIALEANQGIFERELTSDKNISFTIEDKMYPSERLGLMQVQIKVVNFGTRVPVWTFQHLTIQEYMAAVSICNNSWTNRCFIIRYLTSSNQYLSMYKMVIRFVGGILRQNAGRITPILCRHTLPIPISFKNMPMFHQLHYFLELVQISDWIEFTQAFLYLCTVITEIDSAIPEHFKYFNEQLPFPLCLYFRFTISPNEFHCLLQSIHYIRQIQVLYLSDRFITAVQFSSLLPHLESSSVQYLALSFGGKDFNFIRSYTSLLTSHTLLANTKISISLGACNLTEQLPLQSLFRTTDKFRGSLRWIQSDLSQHMLLNLINQFSSLENFYYEPRSHDSNWEDIRSCMIQHQLDALHIRNTSNYIPVTPTILPALPWLKELSWCTEEDCFEALPYIRHLTSLTLLRLISAKAAPLNESLQHALTKLIGSNSNSLRAISLMQLHNVGINSWSSFFSCVTRCNNLIVLQLLNCNFSSEDMSCWYRAVSALKYLVLINLNTISLQDAGMLVVCHSLSYHPALRNLMIKYCNLSSASCLPLMCLIQTLKHVKMLDLSKSELSTPDTSKIELLKEMAEGCTVEIKFWT